MHGDVGLGSVAVDLMVTGPYPKYMNSKHTVATKMDTEKDIMVTPVSSESMDLVRGGNTSVLPK